MIEKVIATRNDFLKWNHLLKNAKPSSDTSVEYREAVFIFREKVESKITNLAKEIFKLPEEVDFALDAHSKELYEAGLDYALEKPKNDGDDYKINPEKIYEWKKVAESIHAKYKDALDKSKKNDEEFNEWCSKKIQLSIEKIELNKMPSFDSDTFYKVAKIICTSLPEDEDDGKEIE